jgi:hypothetical protein
MACYAVMGHNMAPTSAVTRDIGNSSMVNTFPINRDSWLLESPYCLMDVMADGIEASLLAKARNATINRMFLGIFRKRFRVCRDEGQERHDRDSVRGVNIHGSLATRR